MASDKRATDFYAVLGLKKECSATELRNAYKKLALVRNTLVETSFFPVFLHLQLFSVFFFFFFLRSFFVLQLDLFFRSVGFVLLLQ